VSRYTKSAQRSNALNRRAYQLQSNNKYYGITSLASYSKKNGKAVSAEEQIDEMSTRVLRRHKSIEKKQEVRNEGSA
jgi:hypothetical protein